MLTLNDELRTRLRALHALTINDEGGEIFVGLTVAESIFYLAHIAQPDRDTSAAEQTLYLQLRHKHLLARRASLLSDLQGMQASVQRLKE